MIVDLITNPALSRLILLLIVWGIIGYLFVAGQPVPEQLLDAGLLILGFFFGATLQKNGTTARIVHDSTKVLPPNADH